MSNPLPPSDPIARLLSALREARPYVFNRTTDEQRETALIVLERVDAAINEAVGVEHKALLALHAWAAYDALLMDRAAQEKLEAGQLLAASVTGEALDKAYERAVQLTDAAGVQIKSMEFLS